MLRKDIRQGVIYVHARSASALSQFDNGFPILILDIDAWTMSSAGVLRRTPCAVPVGWSSRHKSECGLPALTMPGSVANAPATLLDAMESVRAELIAHVDGQPFAPSLPNHVRFILEQPRQLHGLWSEYAIEREARRAERKRVRDAEAVTQGQRAAANAAARDRIVAVLPDCPWVNDTYAPDLDWAELADLLDAYTAAKLNIDASALPMAFQRGVSG